MKASAPGGLLAVTLLFAGSPAAAQSSLEATCEMAEVQAVGARERCLSAVQAAVSAQPSLGLLVAGGNPTLGTAGEVGLRLGIVPRLSLGARLNVVGVRLPDIIADEIGGTAGDITERYGAPLPALIGDAVIGLTSGVSVAPGLGGIGAVSLLGTASYLPFSLLGVEGFDETTELAWGLGARVHLLDESFIAPGVSLSLVRRQLGTVEFGDICPAELPEGDLPGSSPPARIGACPTAGDPGELRFDLRDWSGRLVASKHLLGLGATAGLGWDRYDSDLGFGFRAPERVTATGVTSTFRVPDADLRSTHWTVFGNLSYSLLIGTLGAEVGWQQGNSPISGFRDLGGEFDPGAGTWFGSVGGRLSL